MALQGTPAKADNACLGRHRLLPTRISVGSHLVTLNTQALSLVANAFIRWRRSPRSAVLTTSSGQVICPYHQSILKSMIHAPLDAAKSLRHQEMSRYHLFVMISIVCPIERQAPIPVFFCHVLYAKYTVLSAWLTTQSPSNIVKIK